MHARRTVAARSVMASVSWRVAQPRHCLVWLEFRRRSHGRVDPGVDGAGAGGPAEGEDRDGGARLVGGDAGSPAPGRCGVGGGAEDRDRAVFGMRVAAWGGRFDLFGRASRSMKSAGLDRLALMADVEPGSGYSGS
ncbi:hypothetical protein ET495_08140 [Xylanimonas allomyrinae]|uniref:Uncharacterized protein n=1 Tax=Xylanimonas allomyrinae TaxID=2509459 RepID=A0A4P6ELG5_9MICO|nr:hypothetical protein [Xylanimonas allomyrinae]QAY63215.1 hypothetical protein ET495_08140 [Xylanimonas allomyrinae]